MATVSTIVTKFSITQGNDFVPRFYVKNADGTVKPLNGASEAIFTLVKGSLELGALVVQRALGSGVTITDADGGEVTVVALSETESALLQPGELYSFGLDINLANITLTVNVGELEVTPNPRV